VLYFLYSSFPSSSLIFKNHHLLFLTLFPPFLFLFCFVYFDFQIFPLAFVFSIVVLAPFSHAIIEFF